MSLDLTGFCILFILIFWLAYGVYSVKKKRVATFLSDTASFGIYFLIILAAAFILKKVGVIG